MATAPELPIMTFGTDSAFEKWIADNHHSTQGVWIKMAKKATGIATVTHDQALDIALCYGWIDGQRKGFDDSYFLQKFTPRRSRSLWSKRNIGKIAKLTAAGRMQPSGMAEVQLAKQDGRWDAAYDSQKNMVLPDDFAKALDNNPSARDFYDSLSRTNQYAIAWRLQTAKRPETRQRRFNVLLEMLKNGEKFY